MKPYISRFAISAIMAFPAFVLSAQDLDPTVVVDREYEGKLMEVHKPQLQMAVPDSIMHFALDFDYSVFESPYKGSYEFSPYLLSLKPDASKEYSPVLFVRAGAGYALHPVLDAVWSPRLGNRFDLDVYALHRSYAGYYTGPEGEWKGYDLYTSAGADARFDWSKGYVGVGIGYDGLSVRDRAWRHSMNALDADVSVGSKVTRNNGFVYKVDLGWDVAGDNASGQASYSRISENRFALNAALGPAFRDSHRMLFDIGMEFVNYDGIGNAGSSQFHIVPHYSYRKGRMYVDFGVRFAKILDSDIYDDAYGAEKLEQMVYPDISFELAVLPESLKLFAHVGGGNRMNTFSSLLERNHHFNVSVPVAPQLDYTVERISADAGLEGRISSRFRYDLRGYYSFFGNGLLDAVCLDDAGSPVCLVGYGIWQRAGVAVNMHWRSDCLSIDGSFRCEDVWGKAFSDGTPFLRPSIFNVDLSVVYNWKRRIFAGVDFDFATARKGTYADIPGYVDLGLYAEYLTSRRLAFWARGGNLLGMEIQRAPLYAEKGAYVTLGITFRY